MAQPMQRRPRMAADPSAATVTVPERRVNSGRRASDALPKVPCPQCGCSVSTVTNSRPVLSRNGVRRRRQCDECGARFTTIEVIDRIG